MNYTQWRMNRRVGVTNGETLQQAWSAFWEKFWRCWVRRDHREKMDSDGACYRCGKAMR